MSVLYGGSRLSPLTTTQIISQPELPSNQIFSETVASVANAVASLPGMIGGSVGISTTRLRAFLASLELSEKEVQRKKAKKVKRLQTEILQLLPEDASLMIDVRGAMLAAFERGASIRALEHVKKAVLKTKTQQDEEDFVLMLLTL